MLFAYTVQTLIFDSGLRDDDRKCLVHGLQLLQVQDVGVLTSKMACVYSGHPDILPLLSIPAVFDVSMEPSDRLAILRNFCSVDTLHFDGDYLLDGC